MLTFDGSRSFERRFVYQWDRKATIWLHFGRLASIPHIFVLFSATPQYSSHSCTDVTNCIPNSPGQAICGVLLACPDGPPPHSCRSASSRGLSGSPPARPHAAPSDPTACPSWKSRMHSPRILASSRFNESTVPRARTLIEPAPEVYGSRTPANFKLNHLRGHPTRVQQEERPQVPRLLTKAGPLHGTIPRAQSSPPIRDYLPHSPRASSSSATPGPTRSTSAVSQTQRTDHRCWLQELDMIVERTSGSPITVALPSLVDGEVNIDEAGSVYLVDEVSDGAGSLVRRQTPSPAGNGRRADDHRQWTYQVRPFAIQPG